MAIHLPFLGSLRAAQSVSHVSSGNAIPLRQFSRRPQQTAGGTLHQEASSSQAAPTLRQQAAEARQRMSSLRQSLSRLREKLHTRQAPAASGSARPQGASSSAPVVASRRHSEAAPDEPPLRPMPEPQPWPSRRRHLLSPIAEERYAELQESQRNTMQQRAYRAGEENAATRRDGLQSQFARLTLRGNGTLSVSESASEHLTAILNETLARPQHRWQAHQASDDNRQHILMDPGGRLYTLQGSTTAFIGLTSSRPQPAWRNQNAQQRLAALPDDTTQALRTGIFSHERAIGGSDEEEEGRVKELVPEQLREHNGRLYRLNESAMRWEQVDKDEEKSYSKLSKQPDGMLYAIYDKKTLHNLSTGEKSEKLKGKITAYCTSVHGATLVLLSDEKTAEQSLMLLNTLGAKKDNQQKITLKTENVDGDKQPFHATAIALHNQRLYALDSEGALWSAAAPGPESSEMIMQPDLSPARLPEQLGAGITFSSLVSHQDGQLMAVVKSNADQKHLCALNGQGQFEARWNLSESLVLDHHEGLLQPRPLAHEMVDLGRAGQLLVHEGKLYAWDKNAGRWEASQEKADSLKRAQDNSGWVILDGLPSRVKVSQKSDKIDGAQHRFALRQLKTSLSVELPLPGFDESNKARAIAPLDSENCAAIAEDNSLQYHRPLAGTRQAHKMMQTLTKAGIGNWLPHTRATLPANGEGNTLTDITTDQNRNLYVLDMQGKLWKMAEADWRAAPGSRPDARWQPVPLPTELGPLERLHNSPTGALMVADKGGRSAVLQLAGMPLEKPDAQQDEQALAQEEGWVVQEAFDPHKALPVSTPKQEPLKAIERLDEASKSVNVRGMTLKYETSIAGMTGRDGNHVNSRLRDRLGAHLINTRLSTPRPMKTAWYATQHNWQGREGLRPLYEQQTHLYGLLKTLQQTAGGSAGEDLQARIAALDTRHFDRAFIDSLRNFIDTVADSAQHHGSLLGQHMGALGADGSANKDFSPSRIKALTQAANPYSDDENLLARLDDVYRRYPLREGSGTLISHMQENGVVARYQKAQPPLGRQRDPHDEMGLVKSRLVLDGLMMAALHEVVDQMEACGKNPQTSPTKIAEIKERFRVLRDEEYGENLVQKATAQGFVNNAQLEACYDAIKSFINALSKPHHGLNITTRTVLKTPDQEQMTAQLLKTLKALEPGENFGFGRNYGGMVTLSVIPGGEVIGIPGVRGNLDRAYSASFSRGDSGINVTFSRNGGGTGTVFGAVGWNPFSQLADAANIKKDLGGNRSIAPSVRLGGLIAVAMQRQLQNSVSFTLSEAELPQFIEQLTHGELNPGALLEKGVNHKVKHGTTLSFNVDATAMAMVGGGLRFPTGGGDGKKNSATARVGGMVQLGANILNAQRERSTTHSATGSTQGRSDNRLRMFNTASAGIGINGGVGITTNPSANLRIPLFGVNSTTIQASIDNRTKHSMSLDIARAEPVHPRQLEKLIEQVSSNFDDPQTNKLLQEIKDADKPPEKEKSELSSELKALQKASLRERKANPGGWRLLSKTEQATLDTLNKGESAAKEKSDKFSTFLQDEQQATANKLDKLLTHLLALTPANNGQYGVILSARALNLQRKAHALHCHALNSAEYQSTYNNLRKVDSNNLMHVVHSLFASELPESAAEAISRFMEEKPLLKEVIRELQKNRNTQAVVTLELQDEQRFALQQKWLRHETQPEEVAALLRDRESLRVKSISFSETDTKQEGINVPLFVAGSNSAASVSVSRNLGKINFNYGANQLSPVAFTLEGEIAQASQALVDALTNAEIQDKRGRL